VARPLCVLPPTERATAAAAAVKRAVLAAAAAFIELSRPRRATAERLPRQPTPTSVPLARDPPRACFSCRAGACQPRIRLKRAAHRPLVPAQQLGGVNGLISGVPRSWLERLPGACATGLRKQTVHKPRLGCLVKYRHRAADCELTRLCCSELAT
jgi:hypothetical protein